MTSLDIHGALNAPLDTFADGINRHEPERVTEFFTPDALFQGFDPVPGHGQRFSAAYYATSSRPVSEPITTFTA